MQGVEYAIKRYEASLKEIERLKQSEFPYPNSSEALAELEKVFQKQLDALGKLTPANTPLVRKNACTQSLYTLFLYTPFLGLILRSTNIRNAFEVYYPLLRIARILLGPSVRLILSSEWDYSPFTYMPDDELKDFVLIGHPAQESSNPLLIPLAGHELGHNVWEQMGLSAKYDSAVRKTVVGMIDSQFWVEFQQLFPHIKKGTLETDLFAYETWLPAQIWGMRQLEESFCDAMGLRLFGEAYLHAFAYLLSPSLPGERAVYYPNMKDRVDYLTVASKQMSLTIPSGFGDLFDAEEEPKEASQKLLMSVADTACKKHLPEMISEARTYANTCMAPTRSQSVVANIVEQFDLVIPTKGKVNITDIINAGWICYHNASLWGSVPQIESADKLRILHDLILKSLEVTEFEERISAP